MLRKRGKKWYYSIETEDEYGRRQRVERVGTESYAETRKMEKQAQSEYDKKLRINAGRNVTFEKLLDEWKESLPYTGLKPNTVKRYTTIIEKHLKPTLGHLPLKQITPRMLQHFLNQQKLGYSSLNSMCTVMKKSFRYAVVMCEYLETSPAIYVRPPKEIKEVTEEEPFSRDDLDRIFERFADNDFAIAIYLAYYAGLRIGECCSLTWRDVDLKSNELHIHTTLVNSDGWMIQPIPKSRRSIRTVQISKKLHDHLETARFLMNKNRFKYGPYYEESGFVVRHDNGSGITPDNIRYFNRWCKETLGHGSFHTLRHTYATNLLEGGADIELVSKQLGHASISVTAQVYSHVLDRRKTKLISIIDEAL